MPTLLPMTSVLILADDAVLGARWAAGLAEFGCRAWTAACDVPADVRLDAIVTNTSVVAAAGGIERSDLARGQVGVVAVGRGGPADVTLPADATEREMALACRLLSEVVRLRRQARRAARMRRALERLAMTDPVTGLPNRRAWREELSSRLHPPPVEGGSARRLCLAILDLDHFKRINESAGYAAGDALLKAAGRVLRGALDGRHFLARLGGDEFGLLAWTRDGGAAEAMVENLRSRLPVGLSMAEMPGVSASAGLCAEREGGPVTADELFEAADRALRAAKAAGRDTSRRAVLTNA